MHVYKSWLVLLSFLLAFLVSCSVGSINHQQAQAANVGFVKASGTHLILNGVNYKFDGLNMYYLNSRGNCGPTYSSSQVATSFNDQAGGEAVRAWFYQKLATVNGQLNWSVFDNSLNLANQHGKRVIVTLIDQWGACTSRGYLGLSWYQGGYKQHLSGEIMSYRQYVYDIVSRYKNNPTVLMFQLVNEPEAKTGSGGTCYESSAARALRAFADDVGGMIHSIDPNHLVSLGGMGSGQCGMAGSDYQYVNASPGNNLCEFHDYGHPSTWIPSNLQTRLNQCRILNKPLFVGETGIHVPDQASVWQRHIDFNNKFSAQENAGVVGELIWSWSLFDNTGWHINPSDPVIGSGLLYRY